MPTDKDPNVGTAIFQGLGDFLGAIPGAMEQKRQNDIQNLMTALQVDQAQRAQESFALERDLGRMKLVEANLSIIGAIEKLHEPKTLTGKLGKEFEIPAPIAPDLGSAIGYIQDNVLRPGTKFSLDGLTIQQPEPEKPVLSPEDKGRAAGREYVARQEVIEGAGLGGTTKAGGEEKLTKKDAAAREAIFAEYPEYVAQRRWNEYITGKDPADDAKKLYNTRLDDLSGGLFSSGEPPDAADRADAALESGYSPIYGMTRQEMIDGVMKALKAGSISTTRAIAAIEGIHSHFDNIYNETVSFFSPTDRAQRPLGQYAK